MENNNEKEENIKDIINIENDNELMKDEGMEAEETGQVLYRRTLGKKLCALTLTNENMSKIVCCLIHDEEIIKKLKMGDLVYIKGKIHYRKNIPANKNIEVDIIKILGEGPDSDKINEKRKFFIKNKNKLTNYNALCSFIKKGLKCPNENCLFRHEIKDDEEKEIIEKNKIKKENAFKKVHEGDFMDQKDKLHKVYRNSNFADFLVSKFGLENLKKGYILDIAGGKGLISYYLTTKYNLKCKVIDPRGAFMPKNKIKELAKKNLKIEEIKEIFNLKTCTNYINNCSLIIGMHPDEATVDIVDVALTNKINFAVVPCCVFHNKFPDRKLKNGKEVIEYMDLIQYILEKDDKLLIDYLNINGRNRVIYKFYS